MAVALEQHGDGEPLVLVHGLATTRSVWRRVLPLLAHRRVVALDVPGFGASPPAGPGFALADVALRVADAVRDAGVEEPYDLVGHSMGGAVALELAARRPRVVRRLVLVAPAGLRPLPPQVTRASGLAAHRFIAARRRAEALADLPWGRRLLMWPGTADPAALPPGEVRALLTASRGATRTADALATVGSADLREQLRRLPLPVAALWGDGDRIVAPGGMDVVRELRPGAATATVPGAGHIPMVERPAAFVAALEDVLARTSPDGDIAVPAPS
ncbi:alpha/beta fold hydrolase [Conexibacter sp. SYSU D00693]|uniref:alpha/beta fold hydrolase n=1 Tax=Conexibacter sp. SYSU D00693 TaxID=2812560 RepID=UPI00196B590F|nr:alpha/beta fold hydrolase [Conexibacter sp. SYSU D00693]